MSGDASLTNITYLGSVNTFAIITSHWPSIAHDLLHVRAAMLSRYHGMMLITHTYKFCSQQCLGSLVELIMSTLLGSFDNQAV
jgi:hypothetical protein